VNARIMVFLPQLTFVDYRKINLTTAPPGCLGETHSARNSPVAGRSASMTKAS
jgi:hypothetical protein